MAAPDKTFRLLVVTPEGTTFDEAVTSVVFPAADGEVGIYANRAPLLARLGYGTARITRPGGGTTSLFVSGGFAQVADNVCTLLPSEARAVGAIDVATVRRRLDSLTAAGSAATAEPVKKLRAQLKAAGVT